MQVSLVGVNHRTTPVSVREKVAVGVEQLEDCLSRLHNYVPHGLILSTCNRTEVYATSRDGKLGVEASIKFLKDHSNMSDVSLLRHVYIHQGQAVVEQLFQVACGLDSMIIGEFEVLGQVNHALEVAEGAGMVNPLLRNLFLSAIRTGRRVRVKTGISKNALSVSSVAVDLAERAVGDLAGSKIIVIGAGEAGRLVAQAAKKRGANQIVVANRTRKRAAPLAKALGATAVDLKNLESELVTAHLVITCTGAPYRILDAGRVREAMKARPELPLVIIDIAVPRNAESSVGEIDNVFLYDIDDLTELSNQNYQQREGEIQAALAIIAAEVDKFNSWWQALEVRPIVGALMKKADDIRQEQLNKTLRKLPPLSDEERESLEAMTRSIVNKILMEPIDHLKTKTNGNQDYAELVSELFQLNTEQWE
ncbi:MAG: glutamyl-tRNA reductase [Chloroflexi bacterium]|nr:glutamyl-tRNA reductase [Chloroflexota bacterium]MBI3930723.1 glutamyl-tRNA reductase [Chloroflexota bacterium]